MPGMRLFPTPVGVFLINRNSMLRIVSLPHARGGVSRTISRRHAGAPSSPRPWGCFFCFFEFKRHVTVFPTPVGVFLLKCCEFLILCCLPHARGGVSAFDIAANFDSPSSPRPWGCFRHDCTGRSSHRVFPTPVGVFPPLAWHGQASGCLPHARGGVSIFRCSCASMYGSSPRPWGCFLGITAVSDIRTLFPTPVGVFLQRL